MTNFNRILLFISCIIGTIIGFTWFFNPQGLTYFSPIPQEVFKWMFFGCWTCFIGIHIAYLKEKKDFRTQLNEINLANRIDLSQKDIKQHVDVKFSQLEDKVDDNYEKLNDRQNLIENKIEVVRIEIKDTKEVLFMEVKDTKENNERIKQHNFEILEKISRIENFDMINRNTIQKLRDALEEAIRHSENKELTLFITMRSESFIRFVEYMIKEFDWKCEDCPRYVLEKLMIENNECRMRGRDLIEPDFVEFFYAIHDSKVSNIRNKLQNMFKHKMNNRSYRFQIMAEEFMNEFLFDSLKSYEDFKTLSIVSKEANKLYGDLNGNSVSHQ